MKVPTYKIEQLIKGNIANYNAALVYGSNYGLANKRFDNISQIIVKDTKDPFLVSNIDIEKIKNDISCIADEFHAISLMPGRKIIRIREYLDNKESVELLEYLFSSVKNPSSCNFILILAQELGRTSKLRALFEKEKYKNIVTIACYNDNKVALMAIVRKELDKHKIKYEPMLIEYIVDLFNTDRMLIMSEIEKIILYLGDKKELTLDILSTVVSGFNEFNYQELVNDIASFKLKKISKKISSMILQGIYPISIIRAMSHYFHNLYYIKSIVQSEKQPVAEAIKLLRPPLFFQQKPIFLQHLSLWNLKNLKTIQLDLQKTEILCKQGLVDSKIILEKFILCDLLKFKQV